MDGGLIWLNLIPILNVVWPFIFNHAVKKSYTNEFRQKGIQVQVNLTSGYLYPTFQTLSSIVLIFIYLNSLFTMLNFESAYVLNGNVVNTLDELILYSTIGFMFVAIFGIISTIFWIVFWVNTVKLKNILVSSIGGNSQILEISVDKEILSEETLNSKESSSSDNVKISDVESQNQKLDSIKAITPIDILKKYHDMLNEGLINQSDFDKIKNELLKK
jgi:hypothetical protein